MASDQKAPLKLLAQLKLTELDDRIRPTIKILYEELIQTCATPFIGAG